MTDREQTRRDAHEQLREMIGLYVPAGFRDDDGVWNAGPHRARALHYLDALLTELEQAERQRDLYLRQYDELDELLERYVVATTVTE